MNINIERKQVKPNKAPKWMPRWAIKPVNNIRKTIGLQPFVFELKDRWKVKSAKSFDSQFNEKAIDELGRMVADEIRKTR